MDYKKALITFKKNGHFNEKFSYNKSGIELAHNGVRFVKERENYVSDNSSLNSKAGESGTRIVLDSRYKFSLKPAYAIVELRENSSAQKAGLKIGDVILSINGKPAHRYSLQQIMYMFYDDDGKRIKLRIDRKGVPLNYSFVLEDLFK